MKKRDKKGISPIIATILLILLIIIIAVIVWLWMRSLTREAITKFDQNVEIVCDQVSFDGSYSASTIFISNTGNVPIWDFDVEREYKGGHETVTLSEEIGTSWPTNGLALGASISGTLTSVEEPTQITLIPILLGTDKRGAEKTQVCDKRYGQVIYVKS